MKKIALSLLLVCLCVSLASAQLLVGGRGAGMGGTGVAASHGIDAAYYNPACLMRGDVMAFDLRIAPGAAYTDMAALSDSLANASDPAKFLLDNYSTNLNFTGNLSGVVGLNFRKIGLSAVPNLNVTVNKPALSLGGTVVAGGRYDPTLTLGTTFSVPYLPAALDVGVNVKSISAIAGSITATVDPLDPNKSNGTQTYGTGTGMGFDLGLLTTLDVPYVSKLAVGAVMRDVSASYVLKSTSKLAHINKTTGQVTFDAEVPLADQTITPDSSTALGAYTTIPGIGLGVALDLDMQKAGSFTHFGLEYPIFFETVVLRAGLVSGPSTNLTTYGAEINFKLVRLGLASAVDANNSGLTRTFADVSIGF
ncbi:MAG: hypothetical protein ABIH50_03510 [bacterium]